MIGLPKKPISEWMTVFFNVRRLFRIAYAVTTKNFVILAIMGLLAGVAPLVSACIIKGLTDSGVHMFASPPTADARSLFILYAVVMIIFRIFVFAIDALQSHAQFSLTKLLGLEVELALSQKIASLSVETFDSPDFLDMESRARKRGMSVLPAIVNTIVMISQSSLTFIGSIATLALFSPVIPMILVSSIYSQMFINGKLIRGQYDLFRRRTQRLRREGYVTSLLTGKQNIISNILYDLSEHFYSIALQYRKVTMNEDCELDAWQWKWRVGGNIASSLLYFCSYLLIAFIVLSSTGSYGTLVMLVSLYSQSELALSRIGSSFMTFYEQKLYMEDLFAVLDHESNRGTLFGQEVFDGEINTITFDKVSFRYPGTELDVLRDVSFTIHKGERVCLVGLNGAGKTTIVHLMTRLYRPTTGRILFNGKDINEFEEKSLMQRISVVPQEISRYYFSVRDNIHFGNICGKFDEKFFRDAAHRLEIDQLVEHYDEKYETILGRMFENGVELSCGQWKKLSFARSEYRDASLYIYDEPNAGIDPIVENTIMRHLLAQSSKRITFIVSHKMAVARESDTIIVLKNGKVVAIGQHDALMEKSAEYSHMYTLQSKHYTGSPVSSGLGQRDASGNNNRVDSREYVT